MAETSPHITVSHHDQYGVVAAASHENHVADHMLRLVGFERLPGSNLYALTEPDRDPTRRGQQAVQSMRAAQYRVTSDAAYDLKPHTRLNSNRGLLDRLESKSALDGNAPSDPTSSTGQRRAQAATSISPARACASPPQRPVVKVGSRPPAPVAQQPVRAR